jgi:putative redox protein
MSGELGVRYLDGDRFAIDVRGHVLLVDQPVDAGGTDEAATPTELFIGGLASCVAFYARRYLARHAIPTTGLAVHARL